MTLFVAILSVLVVGILYASHFGLIIDFAPLNGSFQTFNPIRRLLLGEVPGKDFNPYLGVGLTYITSLGVYLLGDSFAASQFNIHFLLFLCHFLIFLTLFYLIGLSTYRSILLASSVTIIVLNGIVSPLPLYRDFSCSNWLQSIYFPFTGTLSIYPSELITPGNSNLGLRALLPFISSLIVLTSLNWFCKSPVSIILLLGCIAGIQPLWSNDYGITSCIALISIAFIYSVKQRQVPKLFGLLILFMTGALTFLGFATIATRGHIKSWILDNFINVAGDQFWYFEAAGSKVFKLEQIFPHPYLYISLFLIVLLFIYILIDSLHWRYLLLSYIGLTSLLAGVVSNVGGTISTRYYLPLILTSYFIFIALAVPFFKWLLGRILPVFSSLLGQQVSFVYQHYLRDGLLSILIIFCVANVVISFNRIPRIPARDFMYVSELGGWLPNRFESAVQIAREIGDRTSQIPPNQRMLSTYASAMDVIANSKNVTGTDYIIHALGSSMRDHYLDRFQATQPEYVTTLREDYTPWETWLRRVNWWFYREMLPNYEIVDATFYNFVWKRKAAIAVPSFPQVECRLAKVSDREVDVILMGLSPQGEKTLNASYYVDISLDYSSAVRSSGIPIIGSRGLVNAEEIRKLGKPKPTNIFYGMPPRYESWHIPIEYQVGEESIIRLRAYPEDRATLTVTRCSASAISTAESFELSRTFAVEPTPEPGWSNGIAIASSSTNPAENKAAVMINHLDPSQLLNPGTVIQFAHSGERQVGDMQGKKVWVTGAMLDPVKDGYPNPVIVKLQ